MIVEEVLFVTSAGAGIHVFNGVFVGSLPNNGMIISTPSTTRLRYRFCFFCMSDSMMSNVGMLIGPNGTTVTTGDVFDISTLLPGQLQAINTRYRNALTTNDQGVYTCRIPLQSGEMTDINVGIYPSGFSSKCFYTKEPKEYQHILL